MNVRVMAAALFLATGCRTAEIDRIGFEVVTACARDQEAGDRVFRSQEEWDAVFRRGTDVRPPFATHMVASHFDGGGSSCVAFTVEDVLVVQDELRVYATRHVYDGPCILILAFPQVHVQVPQRDLPLRYEIRERRTTERVARACI